MYFIINYVHYNCDSVDMYRVKSAITTDIIYYLNVAVDLHSLLRVT